MPNTMVKFELFLNTNYVSMPEVVQIGIDDTVVLDTVMPLDHVKFECDLADNEHVLWIELCDKHSTNEYRINGQLENDTFIDIKNISINGSMMNHLLNDNAYVIPDWQHHPDVALWFQENKGFVPERLEKSKYLNFKGRYCFHFSLPIRDYLNRNISIHPEYVSLYNESLERYSQLENRLASFKNI